MIVCVCLCVCSTTLSPGDRPPCLIGPGRTFFRYFFGRLVHATRTYVQLATRYSHPGTFRRTQTACRLLFRAMGGAVRLALAGALLVLLGPPAANAAGPPPPSVPVFGSFHSVLAQGEGETVNAATLAAYEASGTAPSVFTDQQPLYVGVMPARGRPSPPRRSATTTRTPTSGRCQEASRRAPRRPAIRGQRSIAMARTAWRTSTPITAPI